MAWTKPMISEISNQDLKILSIAYKEVGEFQNQKEIGDKQSGYFLYH